jgi:hypothetical protein
MSIKICPLLSANPKDKVECEGPNCMWWVQGYTTEKIQICCCAIEFLALKNSEGNYRV